MLDAIINLYCGASLISLMMAPIGGIGLVIGVILFAYPASITLLLIRVFNKNLFIKHEILIPVTIMIIGLVHWVFWICFAFYYNIFEMDSSTVSLIHSLLIGILFISLIMTTPVLFFWRDMDIEGHKVKNNL